jgi:hypothetical protein
MKNTGQAGSIYATLKAQKNTKIRASIIAKDEWYTCNQLPGKYLRL